MIPTKDEIEALRVLAGKASDDRPWSYGWNGDVCAVWGVAIIMADTRQQKEARAAYIAAAHPAMLLHLLACERALRELVESHAVGVGSVEQMDALDARIDTAWQAARALIGASHD